MTPWRQHSGEILSRLFHRLIENFKDSINILGPSTFLNPLAFLKTLVSVESRDSFIIMDIFYVFFLDCNKNFCSYSELGGAPQLFREECVCLK